MQANRSWPVASAPRVVRRGRLFSPFNVPVRLARRVNAVIRHEAAKDGIYLVPLRAFIGIGWIRASAEKITDPNWAGGGTVTEFLNIHLTNDQIAFPFYRDLTTDLFLPHAATLAWIVLLGQMMAGLGILTGTLTTAALLGGLFMNVNFVLAGATDPSPFYIVIQALLLVCGAGTIMGVDGWFAERRKAKWRHSQPPNASGRIRFRCFLVRAMCIPLVLAAGAVGVSAVGYIKDFSPAGSIHDSAAIMSMLGFVVAGWAIVAFLHAGQRAANLRQTKARPQFASDPGTPGARNVPRPPRGKRRNAA
jgi:thiosulfate dehydrogenase [quinone] large subunit